MSVADDWWSHGEQLAVSADAAAGWLYGTLDEPIPQMTVYDWWRHGTQELLPLERDAAWWCWQMDRVPAQPRERVAYVNGECRPVEDVTDERYV